MLRHISRIANEASAGEPTWKSPVLRPSQMMARTYLPTGVRLTAYKGDAADLPPRVLQDFLDAVAAGAAAVPIGRVYRFDQIAQAHTDMEQNRAGGKLVVTT